MLLRLVAKRPVVVVAGILSSLALGAFVMLPESAEAYYGKNSTEAWLRYSGEIDLPWPARADLDVARLNAPGSVANERAVEAVTFQVSHLFGTFQSESFNK